MTVSMPSMNPVQTLRQPIAIQLVAIDPMS